MVSGEIQSELVFNPFEFLVYLPPCYYREPGRYYPVLYLIHGQSFTQDQWDRLGADEISDTLISAGEISPYILVMPRVIDWEEPPEAKFGQAMIEELIPYIDETYRTNKEREARAVGGLSRGAAWALHLGLGYWEMFGAFGGHSLPIFWSDSRMVRGWIDAIPKDSFPRVFVDLADQDLKAIRRSTEWFINLLEEKELPHKFFIFPGIHTEEYWGGHVEEYIRFYTQDW
jgi:enterochelin esterase-like enzyme